MGPQATAAKGTGARRHRAHRYGGVQSRALVVLGSATLDAACPPSESGAVGCDMIWSVMMLKWTRHAYLGPLILVVACAKTTPPAATRAASPTIASTVPRAPPPQAPPSVAEGAA